MKVNLGKLEIARNFRSSIQYFAWLGLTLPVFLREFSLIEAEEARENNKKEKSIWQISTRRFQVISPGLLAVVALPKPPFLISARWHRRGEILVADAVKRSRVCVAWNFTPLQRLGTVLLLHSSSSPSRPGMIHRLSRRLPFHRNYRVHLSFPSRS